MKDTVTGLIQFMVGLDLGSDLWAGNMLAFVSC